jgi:ParB-like chromosome segregation protein Spo0J
MKIEAIKTSQLKYDPANARHHDQANIAAISGSLEKFGQRKPIVVDRTNTVVAGNGTLQAAIALGWAEIYAVRIPEQWTAVETKAFALADNRTAELADWNHEILADTLSELEEFDFEIEAIGFEIPKHPTGDEWASAFDATASDRKDVQQITFTLQTEQAQLVKNALERSKKLGDFGDTGNANANGNAIARICELWIRGYE